MTNAERISALDPSVKSEYARPSQTDGWGFSPPSAGGFLFLEDVRMAVQPIYPGAVDWSGVNPGMYLKLDESGLFTCLVSFFRVVYSPHGGGHGVVILTDPQERDPSAINAVYTDNRALAEYLK